MKRSTGSGTPWVRVVFVAMRDNVAQLPDVVRLLVRIGVDELHVQNLSHDFSDADPAVGPDAGADDRYGGIRAFTADQALWTGADTDRARAAFVDAARVARDHGLQLRLPRLGVPQAPSAPDGPGCSWPWDAAYVTSSGVVQPCCMVMGDDRVTLGRLSEQSFTEIWYGQAYREFRRRLSHEDPPEVCAGCSLYRRTF